MKNDGQNGLKFGMDIIFMIIERSIKKNYFCMKSGLLLFYTFCTNLKNIYSVLTASFCFSKCLLQKYL